MAWIYIGFREGFHAEAAEWGMKKGCLGSSNPGSPFR
jgi:hypothetical protein